MLGIPLGAQCIQPCLSTLHRIPRSLQERITAIKPRDLTRERSMDPLQRIDLFRLVVATSRITFVQQALPGAGRRLAPVRYRVTFIGTLATFLRGDFPFRDQPLPFLDRRPPSVQRRLHAGKPLLSGVQQPFPSIELALTLVQKPGTLVPAIVRKHRLIVKPRPTAEGHPQATTQHAQRGLPAFPAPPPLQDHHTRDPLLNSELMASEESGPREFQHLEGPEDRLLTG